MASLIYNSALRDEATGAIDYDTDTFYAMLVTSSYTPNKDTHDRRDDVTNEVTGTGYTAGGAASSVSVAAVDTTNDRVVITFGSVSWPSSTITARGCVYYKRRGGASSADELVAYNDFGSDITSTGATFTVASSTITKQN
ncbi:MULTISPECIES: hypothetical protein [unclassified Sphingopyxis]|uniref:hypothetical protein n=1 Tax=unclassified Sphingopyxis TaxID=2614943 RepID=UPI00072FB898|nr:MULTISPECIES: hypothetical protein [unclassified Sphingopyxis]KTE23143.1 hypothetical protein ATE61_17810 [Sphingopyxis sp. H057]KTE48482.1 hypothetical protein ATE64_20650 [Sphingopyxis sp. H073]KTE50081.1 hypothetical protein ATE69_18605 [Sphingopyxis sp. H071]KTE58512.1 hypothetical protein ATE66_15135 [Sphingopyxis sp. H107]KTE63211.1 hypothetical protein ATE65_16260 [Sphingopyxis sp. H100]